jgi:hypothetical protein
MITPRLSAVGRSLGSLPIQIDTVEYTDSVSNTYSASYGSSPTRSAAADS